MRSIGIIGIGNLGKMLIKTFSGKSLICGLRTLDQKLINEYPEIDFTTNHGYLVSNVDTVILAVKPTQLKEVCGQIRSAIGFNTPVISVAAAVPLGKIQEWLPESKTIIRCMPNILCSIGKGIVPYYPWTRDNEILLTKIFDPNPLVVLNNDSEVDTSTVISGCSPAFFAWFANILARNDGCSPEITRMLLTSSMKGTASLLETMSSSEIIRLVASPKGATEAALASMDDVNLENSLQIARTRIQNIKEQI